MTELLLYKDAHSYTYKYYITFKICYIIHTFKLSCFYPKTLAVQLGVAGLWYRNFSDFKKKPTYGPCTSSVPFQASGSE
jgi:hypothetical protein